jgi:hypothetical protein
MVERNYQENQVHKIGCDLIRMIGNPADGSDLPLSHLGKTCSHSAGPVEREGLW